MFTIEWSQKLPSNNNLRELPIARHARIKKQRTKTKEMLNFHRVRDALGATPAGHRIVCKMERLASHPLDPGDNHNSSFKAIRDEIAAYLGINDRYEDLLRFEYGPHVPAPRPAQPFVRITFFFEEHVAVKRATVVSNVELATTPRDFAKRGLLSSGIVRNRE